MRRGSSDYPVDRDRPLTHEGIEDLRTVFEALKAKGVSCRKILTSTYRRARETADLAAEVLDGPAVDHCEWLDLHGAFEDYPWDDLKEDTLLVGHEPDLSELCSYLLTGQRKPSREPLFTLNKGGVACVEHPEGQPYKLLWLVNPRDSRANISVLF